MGSFPWRVMVVLGVLAGGEELRWVWSAGEESFEHLAKMALETAWPTLLGMRGGGFVIGWLGGAGQEGVGSRGPSLSGGSVQAERIPKIPRRAEPPAMWEAVLSVQPDPSVANQLVRLVDLLDQPRPGKEQLALIYGYWKLAGAAGRFEFRKEELAFWKALQASAADQPVLERAMAEATAAVEAAAKTLAEAQGSLAQQAGRDPRQWRPWPGDRPHVGGYRTALESLFPSGGVPRRLRLIDKCLPLWVKAIQQRAQAVYAAQDALEALQEAYQQNQCRFAALLWAHSQWQEQHTAFLQASVAYNEQIAEFALAVAGPNAYGPSLVRMLIFTDQHGGQPARDSGGDVRRSSWILGGADSGKDSGVRPADYQPGEAAVVVPTPKPEPLFTPRSQGSPPPGQPEPQAGPSLPLVPLERQDRPSASAGEASQSKSNISSRVGEKSAGGGVPPEGTEVSSSGKGAGGVQQKSVPHEVRRPVMAGEGWGEETLALYPGLVDAAAGVQVKQLALSFHPTVSPQQKVRQEKLLGCLHGVPRDQWREVIEAYWALWHQQAELVALQQYKELLETLGRIVLEQVDRPLGAEARLQWRVLWVASEAELLEAQIRLLEREETLAQYLGIGLEGNLVLATLPHTGSYDLGLEGLPKQLRARWAVRRAAGLIPALYANLQERAHALVSADQTRTQLLQHYRQGQQPLEELLQVYEQQKQTTLDFLQTLADYNQAIADYVILVVPRDLPAEKFVQTLVLQP